MGEKSSRYPNEQDEQVFAHLALRERMREGGVLEPGGYFQLNNGLFSSAFATTVNYLLVLIAFKIDLQPYAEDPVEDDE